MKQKLCDLHTHSIFSDGTYSPEQIIDSAVKLGLSAVALCDHNTVDGLPRFLKAAEKHDIEAVAGAEFSVDYNGKELHLLGLFIDPKHFQTVTSLMNEVNLLKEKSNIELVDSLNSSGYALNYRDIKNSTPNGKVNRAHIATALTNAGYTFSVKEAFDTVLSPKAGHYKEPKRLTVYEVIDFIRSVEALPILAHPFINLTEDELDSFLPNAKQAGLAGIEAEYSLYDDDTRNKALILCQKHGLLCSGGSDFHGDTKPDIFLGRGKGDLAVPYDWFSKLKCAPI